MNHNERVMEVVAAMQLRRPVKRAWEFLNHPNKWTQGSLARDKKGEPVGANDPSAVSWCAVAAMIVCYGRGVWVGKESLLKSDLMAEAKAAGKDENDVDSADWNDTSDYETVINKLRELNI